jgi:hypothetical protein
MLVNYRFTYRPPTASTLALICAASAAFAGCAKDDPAASEESGPKIEITSQGAALTAVENTEIGLKGIVDSGNFLAESASLAETLNALNGNSTTCDVAVAPCDAADPDCVPEQTEECTNDDVTEEDLQEARDDLNEAIDELVTRLREEIFIEANLDAAGTNETQVTYRLGASVLCKVDAAPTTTVDSSGNTVTIDPAPEPELDPECVEKAEKANLRVRLSQPNPDDVDVTFIVGAEDYKPLTLQLYNDRLGLKVDLAEGLKAMEALGEDVEEVDSLDGVVQLQLVKKAKLEYALQFSILEDLGLSFHEEDGSNFSYSLAKSEPTVELALNGNTKTISATYNYGAIQLLAPLKSLASMFEDDAATDAPTLNDPLAPVPEPEPEKTYTGMIELLVAGYTGTFSYTADTDTFSFSNVSLGNKTSTLKHDGNLLASVDLNPEDGRGFDMVIQSEPGSESALISIDPTVDLNIALNFQHVADQVANIPETLLNDKLRMWFAGNEPSFAVENERLRMVSGSFHMSSEQSPESNVDVSEGQCLVSASSTVEVDTGTGEALPAPESTSLFEVEVTACE